MKYKSRIIIICFVLIILNATLVSGKHDPKFTNSRSYSLAYPSFDYNNFNISTYYSGDHGYGVYIGDSINIHLPIVINYKIKFINYKVGTYGVYTNIGLTGVSSFMIDSNTDNYASSSAPPCFSLGIGRSAPYIHFSDKTFYTVKLFIYPNKLILYVNNNYIEKMVELKYSYRNVRLFIRTGGSNHQDGYIQLKNNVIYVYNHRRDTNTLLEFEIHSIDVDPIVSTVL